MREEAVEALFAVLQKSATFVTASRRLRDPEGLDPTETPALFLVESRDGWDRSAGYNELPKREMRLWAVVYINVGAGPENINKIPSSFINPTIEAIEAAVAPDLTTGVFTLGGLFLCDRRIDIAGQGSINIGKAQEFSINLKASSKELYGSNQLPDLVARGTIKATGKVKAARLSALAVNAVFFGQSFAAGGFA